VATKTKSVGGKEYPASAFAYVGDANDISTWHLPIPDADHLRDALARFGQTELPAAAKSRVAKAANFRREEIRRRRQRLRE